MKQINKLSLTSLVIFGLIVANWAFPWWSWGYTVAGGLVVLLVVAFVRYGRDQYWW